MLPTVGSPLLWAGFTGFVLAMLALDLGVFHRKAHAVSLREAAIWSVVWVALAGAFGALVSGWFGPERALEFFTGYLIEKALSIDNIFVFVLVFAAFSVPAEQQHRVLVWGILGALVMRAVFVVLGGALLARFHWAIYLFGGLLVVTGAKMLWSREQPAGVGEGSIVRFVRRVLPVAGEARDGFFVVRDGRRHATPLLLALIALEVTDLIFAVDSVPAIFAISRDPFIVFTSNIFAILGLRSLYFLLSGVIDRFHHLKTGLALVLLFVGAKMVLSDWVTVPVLASLGVIALLVGGSVAASLLFPRKGGPSTVPVAPPRPVTP